jgi:hypothetical protein
LAKAQNQGEKEAAKMERDEKIQALQEMESHPAWRLYQAHLEQLCRLREVVKSEALRVGDNFKATKSQHEIDGINLAVRSVSSLILNLSPKVDIDV